jgi:tRNA(Ile)-lysidine synthase
MNPLAIRVGETIERQRIFHQGQTILLAVSGGVDSMVLLDLLHRLAPPFGWRLVVGHFNHQLRGAESDADEQLVQQTAASMGLPFWAGRGDVRACQMELQVSVEMAARKLRHDFLAAAARQFQATVVALAHHADDQLELFFLRLLRGAGGQGLSGMKWRSQSPSDQAVWLARPLLDQPKAALRTYAREAEISFREDATNFHPNLLRNRVRHELLPLLTSQYQPGLRPALLRLMEIVGSEADLAAELAQSWLDNKSHQGFPELHVALQRQVLRVQLLRRGIEPDFALVEQLRLSADAPSMVGPNRTATRNVAGEVQLREIQPVHFNADKLDVELIGGEGEVVFGSVQLRWQIVPAVLEPLGRPGRELFDADKVGRQARLRHWQPGDRFQPIGLGDRVKLQDLFVNRKVGRAQRHEALVAEGAAGEIFWVEGLRMAERFKLDSQTKRCLTWEWHRV